jgi:hypothetical protein
MLSLKQYHTQQSLLSLNNRFFLLNNRFFLLNNRFFLCCSIEVQREGAKFERAALDKYGLRVILSWQEEDQDKRETAVKVKEHESKEESQLKFKGWTKRKDERRIRMPVDADVKNGGDKVGILKGKPQLPRFDFSTGTTFT